MSHCREGESGNCMVGGGEDDRMTLESMTCNSRPADEQCLTMNVHNNDNNVNKSTTRRASSNDYTPHPRMYVYERVCTTSGLLCSQ